MRLRVSRGVWLALGAILLLGCPGDSDRSPLALAGGVPPPGPDYRNAFAQLLGTPFVGGNGVRWIQDGTIFDALADEIGRARVSVDVVLYIWRPGRASDRIVAALSARRPDVPCRIVVDPVGSTPAFQRDVMPRLGAARCEVKVFRPLGDHAVGPSLARNHRKIVVVDGRVGFTGGFGIADEWLGDGVTGWRDVAVRVEGPVVRQLQLSFAQHWIESRGELLPEAETHAPPGDVGAALGAFVSSSGSVGATPADRMTQLTFHAAHRRLWIANAYFVPNEEILRALEERAAAGVDVRVLLPGPVHDQPSMRDGQRSLYGRLLRAGVRIWEYQPNMMHAKTVVVDDRLAVAGSMNLDPLSLNRLEEGSLAVDDGTATAELAAAYERDLGRAKEMHPDSPEIPGPWGVFVREAFRRLGVGPGR